MIKFYLYIIKLYYKCRKHKRLTKIKNLNKDEKITGNNLFNLNLVIKNEENNISFFKNFSLY